MGRSLIASSVAAALVVAPLLDAQSAPRRFPVDTASVATVHAAFKAGRLTCRELVSRYLARIDALDKHGPAINSIVLANPDALAVAESPDRRFARSGPGPLYTSDRADEAPGWRLGRSGT